MSSVTTERTFSIRTGLAASTVTPGSTAPDASFTTPAMDACAYTTEGTRIPEQDHGEHAYESTHRLSPPDRSARHPLETHTMIRRNSAVPPLPAPPASLL